MPVRVVVVASVVLLAAASNEVLGQARWDQFRGPSGAL